MKKALTIVILLSIFFSLSLAEAQAPTPPDVPTLGPVIICSAGDSGNFVKITSLENQTKYPNPIQLNFTIQQMTLMGQFYNVGYSIDGGTVSSVRDFVNKSIDNSGSADWYWYKATVVGSLILPALSAGFHRITVYSGWQYLGIPENPRLERFEVTAYATVEFTVGNSGAVPSDANTMPSTSASPIPTPALPEFSISPSQNPTPTPAQSTTQTGLLLGLGWEQTAFVVLVVVVACLAVGMVLWRRVAAKR